MVNKNLARRYRAEKRFRAYGVASVLLGLLCLLFLFTDIVSKGSRGFFYHYIPLEVTLESGRVVISWYI